VALLDEHDSRVLTVVGDMLLLLERGAQTLSALGTPYGRCVALLVVKSRALAIACIGGCLDGLGQEAGALLRPLIEASELIVYIGQDPTRIDEFYEDRLPSAGTVAKRICGDFRDAREYLNQHSSHLSFGPESMGRFVRFEEGGKVTLTLDPPVPLVTLLANVKLTFAMVALTAIHAADCCTLAGSPDALAFALAVNEAKTRGIDVIESAIRSVEA